jgi:hypothetical protein
VRTPFARLAGLAAAVTLVVAPMVAIAPAQASTPGTGTLTVNIADDLGHPVVGSALLVDADGDITPIGTPAAGVSTITAEVPVGSYGLVVFGGWSGITCLGLQTCSFLSSMGGGGAGPAIAVPAVVMADQGSKTVNVTTKTPTLIGTGKVGSALKVVVPSSLTEFSSVYGGGYYGGFSTLPGVTWQVDGQPIAAADQQTFLPTGESVGKSVTALVSYPTIVSYFIQTYFDFDATPAPFATPGIMISKVAPSLKVTLPGKIKQGQRPKALIKLNSLGKPLAGLVQVKIKGKRTINGLVRAGFAEVKLPALKPGKYKVTATYGGTDVYAAASVTKNLVVKAKKKPKKKK